MATETNADTAPIEADIRRSRAELAGSLEALADRLAPKKVIARAKVQLATRVEGLKERLNPVRVVQRKLGRSQPELSGPGARAINVRAESSAAESAPALDRGAAT
ncbi:MAG TPA: DUF3618 domain-containing protein [Acidimicrobiales bacterium]|jgi:hypothetical protein|nr:DUF3618 domain-containing protein [Acidimicrobiales bacterium]